MNDEPTEFRQEGIDNLFARVRSNVSGLSSVEASRRFSRFGANTIAEPPRASLFRKIVKRLAEPLVAILLVAAGIAGFSGEWVSLAIIVSVITL